jgi:hypothetical protein
LPLKRGLRQFDGSFKPRTQKSAFPNAPQKALTGGLGGFGSGTAEHSGSAKRSNVSGAFERGLNGSRTGRRARAGNVATNFDLTANVLTKQNRGRRCRATSNATKNGADWYGNRGEGSGEGAQCCARFSPAECTS